MPSGCFSGDPGSDTYYSDFRGAYGGVMYSEKVTVYMSYEQRREIEREAHAAHLKVSDWCRRELAAAVNRSKQEQRNDKQEGGSDG